MGHPEPLFRYVLANLKYRYRLQLLVSLGLGPRFKTFYDHSATKVT